MAGRKVKTMAIHVNGEELSEEAAYSLAGQLENEAADFGGYAIDIYPDLPDEDTATGPMGDDEIRELIAACIERATSDDDLTSSLLDLAHTAVARGIAPVEPAPATGSTTSTTLAAADVKPTEADLTQARADAANWPNVASLHVWYAGVSRANGEDLAEAFAKGNARGAAYLLRRMAAVTVAMSEREYWLTARTTDH